MLLQMMATGAMGGGISSAVARAIGANDRERASALALHAVVIALVAGLLFSLIVVGFARPIFSALGGTGAVLDEAIAYARAVFVGAIAIWLAQALASVVRGTGNMRVPAAALLLIALLQIAVGGALGLGLAGLPRLGMHGVGLGTVVANTCAALVLLWFLRSSHAPVRLTWNFALLDRHLFHDILKVGALACFSALQAIGTLLILAYVVSQLSPAALAGYGIGTRLELLLIPITFAIGVAATSMVGIAIGAGEITRARRVAWTAAALAFALTGVIGVTVTLAPSLWSGLFASDAAVLTAANDYLRIAGPAFALFGLAHCLYFASQGTGRILPLVLAQSTRLVVVIAGALWVVSAGPTPARAFAVAAIGMAAYGLAALVAMYASRWGR
jgi:putative MATE family efflux protein